MNTFTKHFPPSQNSFSLTWSCTASGPFPATWQSWRTLAGRSPPQSRRSASLRFGGHRWTVVFLRRTLHSICTLGLGSRLQHTFHIKHALYFRFFFFFLAVVVATIFNLSHERWGVNSCRNFTGSTTTTSWSPDAGNQDLDRKGFPNSEQQNIHSRSNPYKNRGRTLNYGITFSWCADSPLLNRCVDCVMN